MDIINLSNNLLKREYLLIYLLVSSVSKFPQLTDEIFKILSFQKWISQMETMRRMLISCILKDICDLENFLDINYLY